LRDLVEFGIAGTEVVEGWGIVGMELERLLVTGKSLGDLVSEEKDVAEIVVGDGGVGLGGEGLLEVMKGLVEEALVLENDS